MTNEVPDAMIEAPEPVEMIEAETPQVEGAPAATEQKMQPLDEIIAKIREFYRSSERTSAEVRIISEYLPTMREPDVRQLYQELTTLSQKKATDQPWIGSVPQEHKPDNF